MKDLLKTIITPLVDHEADVQIEEVDEGYTTILQLRVAPDDMGRVIGKAGRRAQAIRSIMKAKASVENKRVIVEILDD